MAILILKSCVAAFPPLAGDQQLKDSNVYILYYTYLVNSAHCFLVFIVCFKIFDMDRDNALNPQELQHMIDILLFVAKENNQTNNEDYKKLLDELNKRLCADGSLCQEEFLMWSVDDNQLVAPMLELLFQVCHVSLGLKPHCRHHEHEIGLFFFICVVCMFYLLVFVFVC